MYSENFDYYRPKNLKEAIALLKSKKDAKLIAGGHSLIPAMKLRLSSPSALIDISRIETLKKITVSKSMLHVGGLTTHSTVAGSKEVTTLCPVLSEVALNIGDLQVRNRGTMAGSLAHADPAADYPTAMLALGAEISTEGPKGKRKILAHDFFVDLFTTALTDEEILTEVSVPVIGGGQGGCYLKHRHPASSYAVVGIAACVATENGVVKNVRLAIGGVTSVPVIVESVSHSLVGRVPDSTAIFEACSHVTEALESPLSDVYASAEYRTHLAMVLSRRALTEAVQRAEKQT